MSVEQQIVSLENEINNLMALVDLKSQRLTKLLEEKDESYKIVKHD